MKHRHHHLLLPSSLLLLSLTGCWDNTPPPPRVPVPGQGTTALRPSDPVRPLAQPTLPADPPPSSSSATPAQPPTGTTTVHTETIAAQPPAEQQRFVQLYNQVGRPHIAIFVNRTLEGAIVATSAGAPAGAQADLYLHPGQYDAVYARSVDYDTIERGMNDWIASNGQVAVTSPAVSRDRLGEATAKEIQAGHPQALADVAKQLDADVLIQVAAQPTRQTADGIQVRLVAEAMNTKGGQSLGRAVVEASPPLDKTQITLATRALAGKLMDEMVRTWQAPPPDAFRRPETTTPVTPSTPAPVPTNTPPTAPAPTTPPAPAPAPAPAPVAPQPPVAPVAPAAPVAPPAPPAP